jgi:hypothetical protein
MPQVDRSWYAQTEASQPFLQDYQKHMINGKERNVWIPDGGTFGQEPPGKKYHIKRRAWKKDQ